METTGYVKMKAILAYILHNVAATAHSVQANPE